MPRLIDANALLQSEIKRCGSIPTIGSGYTNETSFKRILDQAPTVDAVEVVHGEWLDGAGVDHNGNTVYTSIDCSACEEVFKIETHDREYWKARFKVCPFCGANMMDGDGDG